MRISIWFCSLSATEARVVNLIPLREPSPPIFNLLDKLNQSLAVSKAKVLVNVDQKLNICGFPLSSLSIANEFEFVPVERFEFANMSCQFVPFQI